MHDQKETTMTKVDILGVQFNNVTMLDMIEHVKTFFTQETEDNLFIVTSLIQKSLIMRQSIVLINS